MMGGCKMWGRVGGVVVMWAVMGAVVGAVEVVCGRECTCWEEITNIVTEYRVICNNTSHQVTLTEEVFAHRTMLETRNYVRVEAPSESTAIIVTEEFVRTWRDQVFSSLDVWGGRLLLPQVESLSQADTLFSSVSGGVGLINVTMDVLPGGLFGGKKEAKLRLSRCWVGRIAAGLLREVKKLQYLQIEDSTVGVFEGPLGDDQLSISSKKDPNYSTSPIFVHNSKFGVLETGALKIRINNENTMLTEVKVGEMKEGAVEVSGPGKVVLSRCSVADLQLDAIKLHGAASVSITNSSLIVQRGALSQFPCNFYQHINYNNIVVLPALAAGGADNLTNVSVTPTDPVLLSQSRHSVEELMKEELGQALHPTCVEGNLPAWLSSLAELPLPQPRREKHALLHTGLYIFVGVSLAAMIIVVILTCLLVKVRRRRAPTCSTNQVVVMSHLSAEDPIYDEPGHLTLLPPPVPPPSALLDDVCSGKQDDSCAAAATMNDNCASRPGQPPHVKAVENQYMSMC
nr:uncharacterized protein LOC123771089 isoform X2 [Procambarus clarkii]